MAEADFTSILSSKPKHKIFNKYHDLHKKWYVLGVELEIDNEDLKEIEVKYSDDTMRMLKIFGVWLEKGENPTYRTLLKALVVIDKKDIAQSICTDLGKWLPHSRMIAILTLIVNLEIDHVHTPYLDHL